MSRETNRIKCRVRGFHSHFVYKSLDSFMIIVRHGSLSETASSLRNKRNKSDHQESKRTSIKFSNGSSHATVRDLSKHHHRNFDKLCDRAGGGLDFSSVQSEQMTGFAGSPLPLRHIWTPPNTPACCRPRRPFPIIIPTPATMELTCTPPNITT